MPGGAGRAADSSDAPRPPAEAPPPIYFQYVGRTALTAVGPRSGKRYRFPRRGAVVRIDPRDRRAFATVPQLRQVRRP